MWPSANYGDFRINVYYADVNLADLETLLAVARERSFSRAAEKLHRTQPAVSLAIRRLEEACGEVLFDRASKQARLTQAGELVAQRAIQMLAQRSRMEQELLELRGKHRGKVTVGANESTAFFLLPVIEAFTARYPQIKIEVRRSLSRNIPAEVLAGNLDMGMVAYDPEQRDLRQAVVYQDRLAFIVYPSHPLAEAGKRRTPPAAVELARLGQESFIAHNVESPYRDFTVGTFRHHQVPLNIAIEMPSLESIKQLVMRGLGVAFVPRISAQREIEAGTLCEVPILQFKVERPLRLLSPRRGRLSHAAQAFWEMATAEAAAAAQS
jgi:DNA-binding transcriptional LysR family regulator